MSLGKDCVLLTAVCWSGLTVQSKFEEIRKSNMVAAQRLVQSHYSSSSSDEEDEEIGTRDVKKGKILASTFTTYTVQTGNTKKSYVFWSLPDSNNNNNNNTFNLLYYSTTLYYYNSLFTSSITLL